MIVLLLSLLVSGASTWMTTAAAHAQNNEKKCTAKAIVTGDHDNIESGQKVLTVKVGATSNEDHKLAWVAEVGNDDGRSDKSSQHRVVLRRIGDGADHGWLGVSITNVSDALADQFDLDSEGVLVQNVVKDSPADKGGLKVNDIILTIDGDSVNGKVGRAIELVKQHKPDEAVNLSVLRDGRRTTLTVTLGSRAELGGHFVWKVEGTPDAEFEDRVHTYGGVLRRGDDGKWSVEGLGDLKSLEDLPGNLRMFLPKGGTRSTQVFVENGTKKVKTRVEENGKVIVVERTGDGEITVTRVDNNGNKTDVYADADELKDADEEAFDLLEDADDNTVIVDDVNGVHDFDFNFSFDSDEWKERMAEWHEKLEEGLSGVGEIQEETMERLHDVLKNLEIDGVDIQGLDDLKNLPELLHTEKGPHVLHGMTFLGQRKPKQHFEVRADGTIEVTTRSGDSELTQLFNDADDLANRKPKLFEKYEKLMDADEK